MTIKFANNVSTTLANSALVGQTTMEVASVAGFPTLILGDYFYGTLTNNLGAIEIVEVTSIAGNVLTCVRGAEGTAPQDWATGATFEIRVTAAGLTKVLDTTEVVAEVQTATSGQTVFTLTTFMYAPGENTLSVYLDGVNQIVGLSYEETNPSVVTFADPLHLGALVKFTTLQTSGITTPAAVVIYEPAGAGAVATTVQAKLRESVSVLDFGENTTPGFTDMSPAFRLAIATNKTVLIPAGTYKLASSIAIPNSCFTKFIGEAGVPVQATQLVVDFDGPAFTSAFENTSFYSFENILVTVNNPGAKTLTAFIKDEGASVHCGFKNITLKLFRQPAILATAAFVCTFEHVLIQDCYNYGIKVAGGSDNKFSRVLADHTDGGGMDLVGTGFVIDNFYSEYSCRSNDPATFNETWYDLSLGGSCHTIIGGLISAYPQNNKSPIYLVNSLNTSIVGMRGYALGASAPSYILIEGSDGGLVVQQSSGLTVSGYTNNVIEIDAKGGLGVYPDILYAGNSSRAMLTRAWAAVDASGTLKQSNGIVSCTKVATGTYVLVFYAGVFANANFTVQICSDAPAVIAYRYNAKTATGVTIIFNTPNTGALADPYEFSVSIVGI